jgi:hypothetical protein
VPVVALVALLLGVSRPPAAYLATSSGRVPLAISSWCWGSRCGAPISASTKVARVARGTTLRAELAFAPARTRLAIGGTPVSAATRGHELSWRVTRGGGLTLNVTGALGWVTYVGRIAVH